MASETKKWSSGMRTRKPSDDEAEGDVMEEEREVEEEDAGEDEGEGEMTEEEREAGEEEAWTRSRAPSARRASTGASGERVRSCARGRPAAVRSASMMVSSAASRGERVSLAELQRSRWPDASRRASSALFQERMPQGVTTSESPVWLGGTAEKIDSSLRSG